MKQKAQTKASAIKLKKQMIAEGKTCIDIYKFATKRKWQYFIGNWWEWLRQIS
jgi:hypothetical protein